MNPKEAHRYRANLEHGRIVFERCRASPGIHIRFVSTSSTPVTVDGFVRIN